MFKQGEVLIYQIENFELNTNLKFQTKIFMTSYTRHSQKQTINNLQK